MKRLAAVVTMVVLFGAAWARAQTPATQYAEVPKNNVGIGIGTIIFNGQEGLLSQICAATTNGCFGNQTFAISSGTLGAEQPKTLVRNETLRIFVANNMDNLARDIAVGKGESLDTVAELLSVPAEKRGVFCRRAKASFATIYGSEKVTHVDVLQALSGLAKS
jgi:hypothetical protein